MKKYFKYVGIILTIMMLLLSLSGCGSTAAPTPNSTVSSTGGQDIKEMTVRVAHNMADTTATGQAIKKFAELVGTKSGGKIKVSVYPSGQLYNDVAMSDAVRNGAVEIGMTSMNMWSGLVPAADVWSLPLYPDLDSVDKGLAGGMTDILTKEFNKLSIQPLVWLNYGPGYFISTKKPLSNKANFQGSRVRSMSPMTAKFIESMGGAPLTMGAAEVEQALQRGAIDGALSGASTFIDRHYYEFSKYVVREPVMMGIFMAAANKTWWDKLSAAEKKIFSDAAAEAQVWMTKQMQTLDDQAFKELDSKGMKVITLTPEEKAAWRAAGDAVSKAFLEKTGDIGKQLVDIAGKYATKK